MSVMGFTVSANSPECYGPGPEAIHPRRWIAAPWPQLSNSFHVELLAKFLQISHLLLKQCNFHVPLANCFQRTLGRMLCPKFEHRHDCRFQLGYFAFLGR